MATKTKTAKPKTKAKSKPKTKSKPKAEANLVGFPNSEATYIPETFDVATAATDGMVDKPAVARPRAKQAGFSARDAADMLKILADQTRITIVALLARSPETTVGEIVKNCEVSQPATSHHLSLLRHSGLAFTDRDGKHNRYSLTVRGQIAAKLLATLVEV